MFISSKLLDEILLAELDCELLIITELKDFCYVVTARFFYETAGDLLLEV